ncbi:DUF5615 family PIN-like protein [bacterium]|nr:DUF5615 family PIN-like protein [bacterium]
MNFLVDESVDPQIVDCLRQNKKHFILYVAEMEPGISDDTVLNLANQKEAVLLTADKDFGELVFRQSRIAQGVVLIRLAGLLPKTKAKIVNSTISKHITEIAQAFAVITPNAIRIRRIKGDNM